MTRSGGGGRAGFRGDVEGMRAVAVLVVVLYHAGLGAVGGGFVGVDVFYVLSGFLITGLLWRELREHGRVRLAAFYARRARRLLPAAALVLVVTVVASAVLLSPLRARAVTGDAVAAALYVANYRFARQHTDYLAADTPPSPVQHYWSLGVEEQFYLLWPLLLLVAARGLRRRSPHSPARVAAALAAVGVASAAASLWLTPVSQPWAFFSLPTRAWQLAAGGCVALAAPRLRALPPAAAGAVGWAGLAGVLWAATRLGGQTGYPGAAAFVPVAGTAAVLAAGCASGRLGPAVLLDRAPMRFAGRLSYSWYLWHWPLIVLAPAVLGHRLGLAPNLGLAAASAILAAVTLRLVEDPVRFSTRLRARARRGLAAGATLTAVAASAALVTARALPPAHGRGPAAIPVTLPSTPHVGPGRRPPDSRAARLAAVTAPVLKAVAAGVAVHIPPSNLDPALDDAHADRARPFVDGCHSGFTDTRSGPCTYGDPAGRRSMVLFGDSHATQWFPAFERVARTRHLRLLSLTKSTCPPLRLALFSPYLGRPYRECDQWRDAAMDRIRAARPALVVLGVARHYDAQYRFRVYGPEWLSGLRQSVRAIRATGAQVVVLGPTPKPASDVPECLSEHLTDATACTTPRTQAVSTAGTRAEQAAVRDAGGRYVDVSPWICSAARCAAVVANLLVYRDDNHLTTSFASWLAPVLDAELG